MEQFKDSILRTVHYLLSARVPDIIDILIIAFLIYKLIGIIRRTNSNRIAKGIIIVILVLWTSDWLNLTVINFLLSKAVEVGLLALVILFQPEIRRALERVGSGSILNLLRGDIHVQAMDTAITQTVIACKAMSKSKTGALIVFERLNKLDNQINTGTIIHSDTTAELLKNIFYNKAPLHDGAVIISGGKIAAAACMLPLSGNQNLSRDLGMRHRAGIGMSEHSDAVVAIVSEETGAISIAVDGMLKRHLAPETFEKILRNELIVEEEHGSKKKKLSDYFKVKKHE
ncbi:MAG: TIGR00159 family protein [Firmicutes bacterium HGW-Firmicutes-16]|nr:MAG: TIGR00159 family protein [Firmicutes bacterium HGW-Firmicutes-16]